MNPTKGYYSIIQFCPDLSRVEAANVGVMLFCPERSFLKAVTTSNNSRIIHFFGSKGHDWKRINAMKRGLEDRLQKESPDIRNVEDLKQFIALRANLFQFTPPNPMKVFEPEKDLADLYEKIFGEPANKARQKSLKRYLGDKLSSAGLDRKIAHDLKVTVPVLQKQVEIPYGFQNGRFNLINPVRFGAVDPDHAVATACKYAVEGRSLYDNPDPTLGELQLVIVGQFRPKDNDSQQKVRHVFRDYGVELYRTDELPELVDKIRRTGKDLC